MITRLTLPARPCGGYPLHALRILRSFPRPRHRPAAGLPLRPLCSPRPRSPDIRH